MARDMVTKYGMSDKFGPIALESNSGKTLFGQGVDDKEYSEKVGDEIDQEVSRLLVDARTKAEEILTQHRNVLEIIAKKLLEVENLERVEYEAILDAHGIDYKNKKDSDSPQNNSNSFDNNENK